MLALLLLIPKFGSTSLFRTRVHSIRVSLQRKRGRITNALYLTRTQVEPAARNAFRMACLLSAALFSLHGILNDFVLIVCFYSIAGLSEESIYHTRKFSLHATVVISYSLMFPPPHFLLFRLLLRTFYSFLSLSFFFFFTERRFVLRIVKLRQGSQVDNVFLLS